MNKTNKMIEIREGWFASEYALNDFKKYLHPQAIIFKEEPANELYDQWRLIWWQPEETLLIEAK
ncbi:MAG TPA: hypothetical protein VF974_07450 [Patescibacteria group bacterium]